LDQDASLRNLSPALLAELYGQESGIPFLMLLTLTHVSFGTIRLVNNIVDVTSRGNVYTAFPIKVSLPADDGETTREVSLEIDNTSIEFIDEFRSVTTPIDALVEMILSSIPDTVQISLADLKIKNITYNKNRISAKLYLDDFLNTDFSSERYNPGQFPGIF
jgi:hypothetical protein